MAKTQNKHNLVSKRYSDALVKLAESADLSYEKILLELNKIENVLSDSPDLNDFLNNPLISADDKKEVIVKVFSTDLDGLMINFLKVLVDKGRFEAFAEITRTFKDAVDKFNNISRVKVTSAVNMDDNAKNRLKAKLEEKMNKVVALDWEINPEIIAGLVIQMGDNIIDTSLKLKLEDLSKNITK